MRQSHHHKRTSSLESGRSLDHRIRGLFDVDLSNMADATVVSSFDDQSNLVGSSAISLPPDVHEERQLKLEQIQHEEEQLHHRLHQPLAPPLSPRASRSPDSHRAQHSQRSNSVSQRSSSTSKASEEHQKKATKADPLRHYSLVVLSHIFFIIGSALFIAASYLEYHELSSNHRSIIFLTKKGRDPDEDEAPSGYHLKLSTSIDTYVTRQMICMLGATFCFLQVGFINVVRTPLEKFHFFQILAGFFGLLSAMFWETKTILSDISYFFFVHAMTGQALMLLHSHWKTIIRPAMEELKGEAANTPPPIHPHRPQKRFTFSPRKQQEGHFAFDSSRSLSENPSGLMSEDNEATNTDEQYSIDQKPSSDGGYSFSIENSYSMEEERDSTADLMDETEDDKSLPLMPPAANDSDQSSQSDVTAIRRNVDSTLLQAQNTTREEPQVVMLKFGVICCVADSIFVLGSLIETALTYLTILVLPNQGDDDDDDDEGGESTWNEIARVLNLVPGILWLVCAISTFVATLWLRTHFQLPPPRKTKLRRPSLAPG